jgi:PEGA domain
MSVVRRGILWFLISTVVLCSEGAGAQETAQTDPAAAAELFEQGRAALARKEYEVACPKLAESYRLAPHVGSVISLAECEEGAGRLALARTQWQQAANLARVMNDPRASFAEARVRQLDPRVPRLVLHAAARSPQGLLVRKDGVVVGAPSFDARIPVEVGEHVVTVEAPGFATKVIQVTVQEGETKDVQLDLGEPSPEPAVPAAITRASQAEKTVHASSTVPFVPLAVTTAGLGVVAIGFGTYFGIAALAAKNDPPGTCAPGNGGCNAAGNARNFAFAEGDASTILFVAGGGLVVTGAALWLFAPQRASRSAFRIVPAWGARHASLTLDGRF